MNSSPIIVTGGAGFIGSSVVKELNKRGYHHIIVVDNLGTGEKWKNLVRKNVRDIIHKDLFFDWLKTSAPKELAAIIHLGACSNTLEVDANYLLENNIHYSMRLAEFALVRSIRFVYASSAATYGAMESGFLDDHRELASFEPLNMYGYSKHFFDLWLLNNHALDKVVGLKYFNVFGPNEYHKGRMASAFVKLLPEVLVKGQVALFASDRQEFAHGEQKRDFIYVRDAASMTCDFMESNASGIFNIGSGEAISWNRLAKALFLACKKPANITYFEMPQDLKGKYQYFTQANMDKTWKAIGKRPLYRFEDAVSEYVQDFLIGEKRW